jgi:pyruvate dehydrogenase complex dehydrogenase (E1) component
MEFGVDPAEWRRVLDLANAGEVSLHPDVAKGLDKVCDDYLTQLGDLLQLSRRVTFLTGFGSFPSSKALEEKFSLKATGADQSIDTVLQQHIDTIKMAKEVVAKAISNFIEIDQARADQLAGVDIPQ